MTLCVVWRDGTNIKFASDSRLSFRSVGTSDCGVKIARIPFNIYGPTEPNGEKPLLFCGDLGMAFAGSAIGALIVKEALVEVLYSMQCIPTFHDYGMDGIADFVFRAYGVISKDLCATILEQGLTRIVFAGYCATQQKLRAFRIETDSQNQRQKCEVLIGERDMEIFGSGGEAARSRMPSGANESEIISVVQAVIDDPVVPSVGGNLQYGSFAGSKFRPMGVAKIGDSGVHYWRASLDLNGPDFDQADLLPNFPLLDFTGAHYL